MADIKFINHKELIHHLSYCELTGLFHWKIPTATKIKQGQLAGDTNKDGIRIGILGNQYRAHRLAWFYMKGFWPSYNIDHINGNNTDNRIKNLRDVTQSVNVKNACIRKDNTSGYTGIKWEPDRGVYRVYITIKGKYKYLGRTKDLEEAILLRKSHEKELGYHPNHGRKI